MTTARKEWKPQTPTAQAVYEAGFKYDPVQDIIYSRMDASQWLAGYTWAYDMASPMMSMIIDCEPIYFTSGGMKWMIELWKGQYGLETGAEIGVYNYRNTNVPAGSERWTLYESARPQDFSLLRLAFTLRRNGKELFRRGPEFHWWLTGFKWGVYTDSTLDLKMDATIEFFPSNPRSDHMRGAFLDALEALGYRPATTGGSVHFQFHRPQTQQPGSRKALEKPAQWVNSKLVDAYVDLREELGLTNNNPNGFEIPEGSRSVARSAVKGHPARRLARPVARHVDGKHVARARHRIEHDLHEQHAAHEVFTLFHDKVWHTTRQPRRTT